MKTDKIRFVHKTICNEHNNFFIAERRAVMYLKRLEMTGFKSFADRTELEFVPGITAVVGPNGSGKSNVTDGIRWVLGEQSAKSLRGNKMEDVIFAGSDTRKPLGFCEVSMTFDNSERKLPVDYAEVTITRRVYRSGESEYFLNKQACRLKDIHELFMDTGIGKDAYSMIGQGKIDEILSSKSEDRRVIFEEAAGIVKYKSRKKEAEKKLEGTEQNLSRIHDLIHELKTQVEPLSEQAEKAKKFKELKSELEQVEVGLYVHKIESLHEQWQTTSKEVEKLREEQVTLAAELSKKEAHLEQLKVELTEREKQWEAVQSELLSVSEELEKAEGQKEVRLERIRNRTETKKQLIERIQRLEEECERLRKEAEDVEKRINQKSIELEESKEKLSQLEKQLGLLSDDTDKEVQALIEKIQKAQNQLVALTSEQQYVNEQIHSLKERLSQLDHQEQQGLEEVQSLQEELDQFQVQLYQVEDDLRSAADEVRRLADTRTQLEQEEKDWQQRNRALEQQLNRLRSQLEWMKEMEAEHQGFMQGVKEILKARDRGMDSLKGVHGAVAQLIHVPEEVEAAIETALGGALQHLVVEDEQTGRAGIQYLKEKRYGRATFLPLDVMKARYLPEAEKLKCKQFAGFVGVASDLVSTEEKYRSLIHHLLGLVIVTRTLEDANQLARQLAYRYRVVTLDGDVVNPGGSMTGGSRQQSKTNLLGRSRQIEELEKQLKEKEQMHKALEKEWDKLKQRKEKLEEEWEIIRKRGEERRFKEQELKSLQRERLSTIRAWEEKRNEIIEEKQLAEQKYEQLLHHSQEIKEQIQQLEKEKADWESSLEQRQQIAKQISSERTLISEKITEEKVGVARFHQELMSLKENQERIEREWKRLSEQKKEAEQELQSLDQWQESNSQEMAELDEKIVMLRQKKEEVQMRLNETRSRREQLYLEREAKEKEVRQQQSMLRKQENTLHELEVRVNRLDVELNHLLEKLAEEYEMSFERAKANYPVPEDPVQAEKQVRSLKGKISSLGDVNLGAIEEHARLMERLSFLETQEADLLEAKQKLYDIIQQIEDEMSRRFAEAFELIRVEFQDVFVQMFGGGRADLILSEPDNYLETGIEIVAQPPGKKLQNLNLLSGGERALAALALLFAVLRIKPVPFCVLDEVDAALDEANLTRFTRYMKEFSNRTQFIIITHRKHTMEGADVLYGITMQESGVSKLVSVKLEEYDGVKEAAVGKE